MPSKNVPGKKGVKRMAAKPNRREKKKMLARQKIMDAALQLFVDNGLKETSIAEIMEAADLGTGTFYNYFRSKEDVLEQYIHEKIADARTAIEKTATQPVPASSKLAEILILVSETFQKNSYLTYFFLQLQKSNPTLQAPAGHGMVFKEILLKVIREGQSSGEFNNDIPPEIILELIHGILWSSLNGANQGNDLTNNTRLKLDLLLHGILNKKG